jgi:hypothetical protein
LTLAMPLLACLLALVMAFALPAAATASPARPDASAAAKKKSKKCKKAKTKKAKRKYCAKARTKAKARKNPTVRNPRVTKPAGPAAPAAPPHVGGGPDDTVVIAILDGGINPYHWDFAASKMPQQSDAEPGNDLPLHRPATEWLPGMEKAELQSFEPVKVTLDENDAKTQSVTLAEADATTIKTSKAGEYRGYWLPGTKIIGAMSFAGSAESELFQGVDAHGVGTTSSATGNLHGTCPECLLFYIEYGDDPEAAIEWAQRQPWIDVISNSYGHGDAVPKVYSGANPVKQLEATERGQTLVWSAGNGFENAYVVTNPTTYSSQKGPDWLITVGASSPGKDNHYGNDGEGSSEFGAGKPVDVAGIGDYYPNAYGATGVGDTGPSGFSGTSNAAPTVAGLYGRALYEARKRLAGPSRTQDQGVIAAGAPVPCGAARPDCELADGELTGQELRTRLLHGAVPSEGGMTGPVGIGEGPTAAEFKLAGEGHGTYFARQAGPDSDAWLTEFARITGPLDGSMPALERPAGEREWMIVDSYCRQDNWGSWTGGYYVDGVTELPPDDPAWPGRTAYKNSCPGGPVGGGG